jgi:hypothetical protein
MLRAIWILFVLFLLVAAVAFAQTNASTSSAAANSASGTAPAFDVNAAVETYLAKMSPAQRARSNAY